MVRFEDELWEAIGEQAHVERMSRSAWVRMTCEFALFEGRPSPWALTEEEYKAPRVEKPAPLVKAAKPKVEELRAKMGALPSKAQVVAENDCAHKAVQGSSGAIVCQLCRKPRSMW